MIVHSHCAENIEDDLLPRYEGERLVAIKKLNFPEHAVAPLFNGMIQVTDVVDLTIGVKEKNYRRTYRSTDINKGGGG